MIFHQPGRARPLLSNVGQAGRAAESYKYSISGCSPLAFLHPIAVDSDDPD